MQGNGLKLGITFAFIAMCAYYLWPSIDTFMLNNRLDAMDDAERAEYVDANFSNIQSTREDALKLGLDLLGGMHLTMEIRVDALVRELATDVDATFDQVVVAARTRALDDDVPFIDAFVDEFEDRDANARLSRYFRAPDDGITRRSTNEEVAGWLSLQSDEAINRAIEIIRDRVDRYGVTEPSIQKQGASRIVVEMPGIDDPERIRELLKGTARLEFRLMVDPEDNQRFLSRVIDFYERFGQEADTTTAVADSSNLAAVDSTFDASSLLDDTTAEGSGNPLLDLMSPAPQPSIVFGYVAQNDTAAVNKLLQERAVRDMLPSGVTLMYADRPVGTTPEGVEQYALLGVRADIEMTGEVITDARVEFDQLSNEPMVSMVMNGDGSRTWARITGANVNRNVAIVLDNVVKSYPTVNERIVGGRSQINGLASQAEATDIVTVLKSGALPAPLEIVEESTVGPSLGAASIRSGLMSVIVGLVIVAIFMIFYYRTAGIVADLALIINIIFILGILAGFHATLTLPGIAGVVLTIGMAVDANVLIFERIREEQSTGKTLKASVDGGYAKALSAIVDANITTFFVGVILYSFGVGPIQGFAVTLMAGILSSMFTAIVVTRLVFDHLILDRKMRVNYG